ncbi:TonB-dependent siderophore receptor [Nevskia ramosa]|uniref:TonB-dependent siderophore receptor n=1 Tax=Nevskia ramosa TaxID=64002 RepID=UPI00235322A7|nr:TonB-dependent receptor [Nevskia ramosa]
MKRRKSARRLRAVSLIMLSGNLGAAGLAMAQTSEETPAPAAETTTTSESGATQLKQVDVRGVNRAVNILNNEKVDSVFGFDKSIKDTPRSITSISKETLDKLNINNIDDLVVLSPGSFTQSFFGVAGSLDLRGTPGETYFRGVRRIDNPGNYPTPIGASDRIDIVRGPASPIFGPSKVGGYLNFVPKSERAQDKTDASRTAGEVGVTRGSFDKNVIHGEVGGPGDVAGKKFGYYLYAEGESSGSYYDNSGTDQNIYQAALDAQLTEKSRIEFGGMYQDYRGNQVAGWNRLTQDLINHGTYITGSPKSLDSNGDGLLSAAESAAGDLAIFYPFGSTNPNAAFGNVNSQTAETVNADLAAHPNMALQNPGTTKLKGSQTLTQKDDRLDSKVITLYFDFIHDFSDDFKVVNKTFYESLDNVNENVYGFSQFADTYAIEDQLNFSYTWAGNDYVKAAYQLGASLRYQDFEHGDNFAFEYFDRRDITQPGTPVDRRTLTTRDGPGIEPWSSHTIGNYLDTGVAALADYSFLKSIHLLVGGRWDWVSVDSTACNVNTVACGGTKFSGNENKPSWTISLSYDVPVVGLTPYVTRASQSTLIAGQGGQVDTGNVQSGSALAKSSLTEIGVKGSYLKDRLFLSFDHFKQQRTDLNSQDTVTNNTTESKGYEFEFRGVVTNNLAITGAYTHLDVYNLSALQNGNQFGFAGGSDLPAGVDPSLIYGGVINGLTTIGTGGNTKGRKAGIPDDLVSLNFIYNFSAGLLKGLTSTIGVTHASSTYSGFSQAVQLPSYTLLNIGMNYETKHWKLGITGKNLTDEKYFRSNFPDLFGSTVVLPQLPINWLATVAYRF